jgi:hypothetical protein
LSTLGWIGNEIRTKFARTGTLACNRHESEAGEQCNGKGNARWIWTSFCASVFLSRLPRFFGFRSYLKATRVTAVANGGNTLKDCRRGICALACRADPVAFAEGGSDYTFFRDR